MGKKNRAFTLTELLVVVIVLGVLATVAATKFSRVLETRRTTEAENMLSVVRTEQEARCAMGKPYFGPEQRNQVMTLAKAGTSPNYNYELIDGGIEAHRGEKYALRMWYKTGEICCEGDGCADLSKSYPICSGEAPEDECAVRSGGLPEGDTPPVTPTCTLGDWVPVTSCEDTCGTGDPTPGCISCSPCSEAGLPCVTSKPVTNVTTISKECFKAGQSITFKVEAATEADGADWSRHGVTMPFCNHTITPITIPDNYCGPVAIQTTEMCTSDPCSTMAEGESCIQEVIETTGTCPIEIGFSIDDYMPGGGICKEWVAECKNTGASVSMKVNQLTCQTEGSSYYQRTCE